MCRPHTDTNAHTCGQHQEEYISIYVIKSTGPRTRPGMEELGIATTPLKTGHYWD